MTPYIISASRREDIPAFRTEWFLEKLKEGKVIMSSSFTDYEISFEKTKLIVFWTKNPQPLIEHLDKIPYKYYFHFSLNDYPEYELNIPSLEERIKTFQELSDRIGKHKVIWRYDPIIVNQKIRSDEILSRIENIGNQLYNYTENNTKRYHVNGQYGNSEFTKRQFDQMFITENNKNEKQKNMH